AAWDPRETTDTRRTEVKRTIANLAGAVTLCAAAYLGSQLWAQQPVNQGVPQGMVQSVPPAVTRVAVINLGQVIRNYVKFKNFEAAVNGQKAEVRKRLDDMNNRLMALQAEASKPETASARRDQIDKEVRDLQRRAQDMGEEAKAQISKQEFDHLVQTFKEVQDAVAAYARPR